MSATLWVFLHLLEPDLKIDVFERRDALGYESSDTLNNAWTWHSALCELHYTPYKDGSIDTSKADAIVEKFEISKQFRSYLVEHNFFPKWNEFINWVPHMSIVFWEDDVQFLRDRYNTMTQNPLFKDMMYSEDFEQLKERFPLIMDGRSKDEIIAATRHEMGTDMNFWMLTRNMFDHLNNGENVHIHHHQEVVDLQQLDNGTWKVFVRNSWVVGNKISTKIARYVFLGNGWMAIPLLAKSWVPAGRNYAWFPVDGQWLICNNPKTIAQHHGKVYGKAAVWAPPMSVPHLDTRIVNWRKSLLFGPYAGFTTKFLKQWSVRDFFRSLRWDSLLPLIRVWIKNLSLTMYLFKQWFQSNDDRLAALRSYYPNANPDDRYCAYAGKRVQIIKKNPETWLGELQFWTEVVVSDDNSLSALLWASPGASTSVSIILELLEKSFPEQMKTSKRQKLIQKIVPSYGTSLKDNDELVAQLRSHTHTVLWLSKDSFEEKISGFYE